MPDAHAATRGAGIHLDVGAGHLALRGTARRSASDALVNSLRADRGDRVGQVPPLDTSRLTGDHDGLELEIVPRQRHLNRVLIGWNSNVLALEPDTSNQERDVTDGTASVKVPSSLMVVPVAAPCMAT